PFGCAVTAGKIAQVASALGCTGKVARRADEYGEPFFTDSENFIYDCSFGAIPDPDSLAAGLNRIAGVVDNGLFIGIAALAIVGTPTGTDIIEKK
ncbi:MAG: ribose-5-phosphate isomerase A, partial [Parvibaculum sp.]|nr:ribose-5-phosphate isomerase A [Parvibaculum sp.]